MQLQCGFDGAFWVCSCAMFTFILHRFWTSPLNWIKVKQFQSWLTRSSVKTRRSSLCRAAKLTWRFTFWTPWETHARPAPSIFRTRVQNGEPSRFLRQQWYEIQVLFFGVLIVLDEICYHIRKLCYLFAQKCFAIKSMVRWRHISSARTLLQGSEHIVPGVL